MAKASTLYRPCTKARAGVGRLAPCSHVPRPATALAVTSGPALLGDPLSVFTVAGSEDVGFASQSWGGVF